MLRRTSFLNSSNSARVEVLVVVTINITAFWDVMQICIHVSEETATA
jgi:hypothetical protein